MTVACRVSARLGLLLSLAAAMHVDVLSAQPVASEVAGSVSRAGREPSSALPPSTLSVRAREGWRVWWSAADAPAIWSSSDTVLASQLKFERASDGIEWGELTLAGSGEALRTRLVVVRLDPRRVRLTLDTALPSASRAGWTIERAPRSARFAVNAGQFLSTMPWGLVVLDGRRFLPAGHGPLVSTIAIDSAGAITWSGGDAGGGIGGRTRWAFQSYPTVLHGGEVPPALRGIGNGIDVEHRDARLALGMLADGRLLVVMTRFDLLGPSLGFIPFGLTVPEMAAVMGALGARDATLLDGGISAQMLLRSESGKTHRWKGMRSVPLALVGTSNR
jgi:phosphodiester glycosidase